METPRSPTSVSHRIREGLERVTAVLRHDQWSRATALRLNPTQLAILELVHGRPAGLSVRAVAGHLAVSQPTATDSISTLVGKGLLTKSEASDDRRSSIVRLSREGHALIGQANAIGRGEQAVSMLDADEQDALLGSLVKLITNLQALDAIPIQRMCVSCRYFSPLAHPGAESPHHCKFVDAAFGARDIRIDCRDHEAADPAVQAATWAAYEKGSASTPPGR